MFDDANLPNDTIVQIFFYIVNQMDFPKRAKFISSMEHTSFKRQRLCALGLKRFSCISGKAYGEINEGANEGI